MADTWDVIAKRLRTETPDRVLMLKAAIALEAMAEELAETERDRDIHNGHRRMAEAKLMALGSGGVVGGCALVPVEPTDEMLAATCDDNGRMRMLEFTRPEERSAPFLVPRYAYRAMVQAARSANSVLENGAAVLADANQNNPSGSREQRGNEEGRP